MAEVKILVQGYTSADSSAVASNGEEKTCATITLVRDKKIVMVCDPGVLDSQQILIDALAKEGIVAICGDVFWKENYPENDPYASDLEKLKESRQKVLQLADFIIPGHGGMYKVK